MESKLDNKVCLIAGVTQYFGYSIANALANECVNSSIVSRKK